MESAMDWMADASHCGSPAPRVINLSGGGRGVGLTGTDSTSRNLDDKVWTNRQTYVVCSGNTGPGSQTIWTPGVAKNNNHSPGRDPTPSWTASQRPSGQDS